MNLVCIVAVHHEEACGEPGLRGTTRYREEIAGVSEVVAHHLAWIRHAEMGPEPVLFQWSEEEWSGFESCKGNR
jgi:hypothetical protein